MKRKIAAIFAADIAGYSRLVAEDEEETLRRLASYRQVTDDFIAKCGGRIFNTAGDAVLAEFPSGRPELKWSGKCKAGSRTGKCEAAYSWECAHMTSCRKTTNRLDRGALPLWT